MHYYINGEALGVTRTLGIHRYAFEILKRIDAQEKVAKSFTIVVPRNLETYLTLSHITVKRIGRSVNNRVDKELWCHGDLPSYVKHHHGFGIDLTLAFPNWDQGLVGIDDCIYESYPEDNPGIKGFLSRKLYVKRVKQVAKNKNIKINTLSLFSKNELVNRYGIEAERIAIVPCGWEHVNYIHKDVDVLTEYNLEQRHYYFTLGSRYPHKNISWILRTAVLNKDSLFVVTGTGEFLKEREELPKPDNVIFTGYLSDSKVMALMANSKALIQPSFCEGFGLPPLEALALGTPCLVSSGSCFPEIYGASVGYIDPKIPSSNLDELLVCDEVERAKVLEKNSWSKSAGSFLEELGL